MSQPDLTRREMYDLVWLIPTVRVAESFGLSETSLRKICDRYRVPVPPHRYWMQKATGQNVKRPRLYRTDNPHDEWIYLSLSHIPHPATPPRAAARSRAGVWLVPSISGNSGTAGRAAS
jgi:hypothetical protein